MATMSVASFHFQPQGITGTGETTSAKYQATGVLRRRVLRILSRMARRMKRLYKQLSELSAKAPGNNFLVHEDPALYYPMLTAR